MFFSTGARIVRGNNNIVRDHDFAHLTLNTYMQTLLLLRVYYSFLWIGKFEIKL